MDTLSRMFKKPSTSNKVFLMKRLFNMKIGESRSVVKHVNEFNIATYQLSSVGINFDDEVRPSMLLLSLLES